MGADERRTLEVRRRKSDLRLETSDVRLPWSDVGDQTSDLLPPTTAHRPPLTGPVTLPLLMVLISLDTARRLRQNPPPIAAPEGERWITCRDGPCSASIRTAKRAATGCACVNRIRTIARAAAHRWRTYHLRWRRGCACAHVRWPCTVRCARGRSGARRQGLVAATWSLAQRS